MYEIKYMNFSLVSVKINVSGIFLISHHPHLSKAFVENHFPKQFKALAVLNIHAKGNHGLYLHKKVFNTLRFKSTIFNVCCAWVNKFLCHCSTIAHWLNCTPKRLWAVDLCTHMRAREAHTYIGLFKCPDQMQSRQTSATLDVQLNYFCTLVCVYVF
jgi:hypothetical protein